MSEHLYAQPRHVETSERCDWYHTMELPELGLVAGDWDLRATIDDYLGRYDFRGKRCLDVGSATGYLTFEMERRGAAEVVSLDLDPETHQWEIVPFADPRFDRAAVIAGMRAHVEDRQRGYWLAHRLLGSQARAYYGTVYDLPAELGHFDVAMIGMVLGHLRDPLRALEQVAPLTDEIIVVQAAPQIGEAFAFLMPNPATLSPPNAWWATSDVCLERMLNVVGFEVMDRVLAEHACPARGDTEVCTTTLARRRRFELG
jgi:SAM-dependent methyltransferase